MSYAANLDDELGGLGLDGLPPELREQAQQEKRSQGGYRLDSPADRAHIKEQRGAIWAWLRGLGGNLIKHGVNLTKVPLPVELCEPRSFLERLADSWSYLDLLHAAAAATDPVERLKLVVAFTVGGMRQQVSCDKPFNPILGETLQGLYPCGCSVAMEQVSHHPPVSCWQVHDHAGRFEFTGSSCWSATFTGNSVKGSQTGESRVRFASDGATITWTLPCIHIRGVLFGDRVVKYHDTITFTDDLNGLVCELAIDPAAPRRGLVRRVLHKARHPRGRGTPPHDALVGDLVRLPPGAAGGGGKEQLLDSCSGTWLTDLTWDKGVRSTVLPESFEPTAAAAAPAAAAAAAAGEDAAVVCHSIGSLSSSTASTISEEDGQQQQVDGEDAAAAAGVAAPGGDGSSSRSAPNGISPPQPARGASSSHGSKGGATQQQQLQPAASDAGNSNSSLTASTLAAHTAKPLSQGAGSSLVANVASAATLSSSDAAAHRSSRGITVQKQLWSPASSTVYAMQRLPDDHAHLLPSDCRFRPDVMALAGRCRDAAQRWKLQLEVLQRADRTLRARGGGVSEGGGGHHHHRPSSSRGSDMLPDALSPEPLA